MTSYIIQVILFQLGFLLVFEFLLKKETFFNYNRWYLLLSPLVSLVLPFLKIPQLGEAETVKNLQSMREIYLPEIVINAEEITPAITESETTINPLLVIYVIGVIICLIFFAVKFYKLKQLAKRSNLIKNGAIKIYEIENSDAAFTFFKQIFIGDQLSEIQKTQIMNHEQVHIDQNHSADLFYFEALKILLWFNPLIYIYQSRITSIHEFIADENAMKKSDKKSYYEQLLNSAFGTQNIAFINQFFNHSLIKKRIIMLQKNKSRTVSKFKFLFILPLLICMLTYVACSDEPQETEIETSNLAYTLSDPSQMNGAIKKKHDAYEKFLTENPNYVSWATIDFTDESVHYSIHKASEKVPQGYNRLEVNSENGDSYVMYMNLKQQNSNLVTEQESNESSNLKEAISEMVITNDQQQRALTDVPFAIVEEVPAFQGCSELSGNARKDCTREKITNHVLKNFNTGLGKELGLTGLNRVIVQFRINANGNIDSIKARASKEELKNEAIRVLEMMPQMEPGIQQGKPVNVMYSLPITFRVGE